jgi:hypothetical protein
MYSLGFWMKKTLLKLIPKYGMCESAAEAALQEIKPFIPGEHCSMRYGSQHFQEENKVFTLVPEEFIWIVGLHRENQSVFW